MLRILHTNDLHGRLDAAQESWLAGLRAETDLYFDTGDAIRAGNLALPTGPDPVWPAFQRLELTAGCPGNRESHVSEAALRSKLEGRTTPLLCANWRRKDGSLVFPASQIVAVGSVRVGVLGVMVPMVTARMASRHLSAFLWDAPIHAACTEADRLWPEVDLVIALTHIGSAADHALAEGGAPIDIILGGHSHSVLPAPVQVGQTWIAQGGSHGRYAGVYAWDGQALTGGLLPFQAS
jgi:2',3'-cyclic-nucleotide 2'-phosphodiesterase (5'-nucleotidase family)